MADKAAGTFTQASTEETDEHELTPRPGIAMPDEVADAHDTQQVASASTIVLVQAEEAHCDT